MTAVGFAKCRCTIRRELQYLDRLRTCAAADAGCMCSECVLIFASEWGGSVMDVSNEDCRVGRANEADAK